MTHTPGPWTVALTLTDGRPCIQALGDDHCFDVAYVAPMHEAGKDKTSLEAANASLIAAAPDMLAALQTLLADPYLSDPINNDRMAAARAAIARATG